jgi:hypothetical protein
MIRSLSPRVARASVVAIAMTAVAACSETPTKPQLSARTSAPRLNVSAGAQTPKLYPNSVKYRDTGAKPARGRSGAASLEARALLGKDRETLLEVSTGSLEGGQAPPGNLEKVQVKVFDPQGHYVSTTNRNGLAGGGYAAYRFATLPRGSGLQVQANVGGIDANRTDIVTVSETVKLRPDLVVGIAAPNRALLGVPVQIVGTVRELNGDVGARTDCVLSVDGERVASADGIWVDAGGDVACSFSLAFPTLGTKTLQLSVENVAPGDYDADNNARTASIVIESDVKGFSFFTEAAEWSETFDYRFDFFFKDGPDANGTTITHDEQIRGHQEDGFQHGLMFGSLEREIQFPIRDVQFSNTTDGTVLAAKSFGTLEPTYFQDDDLVRWACVNYFTPLDGTQGWVQVGVCSGVLRYLEPDMPFSSISIHRQNNEVTYVAYTSNGTYRFDYADRLSDTGTWFYTYNFEQQRKLPHYGSDLTIDFSFQSGADIYRTTATIPMTAFDRRPPDEVLNCSEYTPTTTRYEKLCFARSNQHVWGVEGRLTGTGTVEPAAVVFTP